MNRCTRAYAAATWACLEVLACAVPASAAVQVIEGPTPIVGGNAMAAGDITVVNERLGFALAVQSAVPYGVPRGALVDLAPVTDGKLGRDRVVFADFIPDHWSAWLNTYQHVDILERGPERAVIRTTRDWGAVTVVTVYTLVSNSDHVAIHATMTNGGTATLSGLLSGLTLWPNSGFLFGVPGLQGVDEAPASPALANRVVAYDEAWAIALHAAYFDHIGDASRDLYLLHSLRPGESRNFDGWLQVRPSGDLAPVVAVEIDYGHLPSGRIHGVVRDRDSLVIDRPVVVVEKRGKPYAWVVGHGGTYDMTLPQGHYELYGTAKDYSQSRRISIDVAPGSSREHDFGNLEGPGRIDFSVTNTRDGQPLDARIVILKGQQPVVGFLGRSTFFTELSRKGRVEVSIAPGRYVFDVSSGGGFLGHSQAVGVLVAAHRAQHAEVALTRRFDPTLMGWYSADLHHHADQAEAVTPPTDLARSQLAAGLDLLFVSDHDSTINHRALQAIADQRGIPFIPGVELSPSWGHFNAYPLTLGQPLGIDTSTATVDDVFAAARRQGAIVVQANHPFIPYGYLTSIAAGVAPGGFNPTFDLLEINDSAPADDDRVLHALWKFWNAGHHYYLTAGTDTHDVWTTVSGHVRTFAHVDGTLSATAYATSLRAGHGYVSRGPLVFPAVPFGDELKVTPGTPFTLSFDLQSVDGVKRVQLISAGMAQVDKAYADHPQEAHLAFPLCTERSTWFALVVEDAQGHKAYTDPVWIDAVSLPSQSVRSQVCERPKSEIPM